MDLFNQKTGIFSFFLLLLLGGSCTTEKKTVVNDQYKQEYLKQLQKISRNEDSLKIMLKKRIEENNETGIMLSYRILGKNQRENAKFSDAITSHQSALEFALKLKDTLEIVQILNDLGTNFRRIGAMSEAATYNYEALQYINNFSDVENSGRKLRVMTLNGIGNISDKLGYYDEAEKYFREALREEGILGSDVGQAINYANIGSIFKDRQQYDSARVYYNYSLEKNIKAKSKLGIGLCHIHLGNLHKIEKQYDLAKEEYQQAYNLMKNFSDKWHWLNACVALANINLMTNDIGEYKKLIALAEQTANQIKSPGHLAEIYELKHEYAIKQNDFKEALAHYKLSEAMQDSVQGIKNTNHYMDLRVNYERQQNERQLKQIEAENKIKEEKRERTLNMALAGILVGIIVSGLLYYAYYQRTRSNRILKKIEEARTDFFTNLTHEFRTPLTVIQGLNRQLQYRKDLTDKERSKFMLAIERQSENLLKLVNQLLDIAKLKSGSDRVKWERGDIISYFRMTAETFKLFAEEKNVQLTFYTEIAAQEMDFVPFYMDKIISNLLSNAIKHTQNGEKIDFIVTKGKGSETIVVRIADNGEGIHKEELGRIFELFYQSPNAKNQSGTGIGLAFTKMLIEKMNGKIEVESELNKGSVFIVTLPLKNKKLTDIPILENISTIKKDWEIPLTDEDEDVTDEYIEKNKNIGKPIVLVVEDNKDVSLFIKSLLENQYQVVTARNGQEGYELAKQYIPDILITDLMMPIKDGYQLSKEIKETPLLNHIPIIMLTAKVSEQDRLEGLRCGIEAYIQKPFRTEELLLRIENILENRKILKDKYLAMLESSSSPDSRLNTDENLKFLQKIMDIINSEMSTPGFSPTFIADKMAISTSQLNRKLNQIAGVSTSSYILQIKLVKAKKMLHDPLISLSEVSDVCGFYDLSYFSRTFKKEFGITPSQYQKNVANKL